MITTIASPVMGEVPLVTWQLAALLGDAPIIVLLLVLGVLRYLLYQVKKQPSDCLPGLTGRRGRKGRCCLPSNIRPRDSRRSVIGPDLRPRTSMTTDRTHSTGSCRLHLSKTSIFLIWMMSIHLALLAYLLSGSTLYDAIPIIFRFEMDFDGTIIALHFADIVIGFVSAIGGYLVMVALSKLITTAKKRHRKILLRCRPVVIMIPERPRSASSISIFQDTCSWNGSNSPINSLSSSPATSMIGELNHSPDQVRNVPNPPSSNRSSNTSLTGHRLESVYQPPDTDDDVDQESSIVGSPIRTRRLSSISLDLISPPELGNPLMRTKPPLRFSLSSSSDGSDVDIDDDDDKRCRTKPFTSSLSNTDQPGPSTATPDPPLRPAQSLPGHRDISMSPYTVSRLPVTTFGTMGLRDDNSGLQIEDDSSSSLSSSSLNFSDDGDGILDLLNLGSPGHINNNNSVAPAQFFKKNRQIITPNYITVAAVTVVVMISLAGMAVLNFHLIGSPVDHLTRWIAGWMMAALISVIILLPVHCMITTFKSVTACTKKHKKENEFNRSNHRPSPLSSSSSFSSIV